MRYSAFISYSYQDRRWARWLHAGLESYRVPTRMRGRPGRFGPLTARLPPVFRDRDELAAASDLSAAVEAALRESATLIIICSPRSAASRWVNEEIRAFRAMGRGADMRCLIVDGEPHSTDPALECMPPALTEDGSAEPLAADLRKHQDGKAAAKLKLIAGILDVPYDELRQREAVRRQRRLMIVAGFSLIGLLITSGLAVFAMISRDQAVHERDIARQRTLTAERTVSFVKSMFEISDPSEAKGARVTAREVLDRGAEQIRRGLRDEPVVRTELGVTLGEVYGALGLFRQSDALLRWTLRIAHHDPDVAVRQQLALADSLRRLGRYEEAVPLYRRAVAIERRPNARRPDLVSRGLIGLAQAQAELGEDAEAEAHARAALRHDVARLGADHPDVALDLEVLGANAFYKKDYSQARRLIARALAIRSRHEGPNSPSVSDNLMMIGSIAYAEGDAAAALRYYRDRLALDERVLGHDHPDVAVSLNNIGRILMEQRRYAEAAQLLERAVAIGRKERGETHDDMAFAFANLALARDGLGQMAAATDLMQRALLAARMHRHRTLGPILTDLGALRCRAHRIDDGIALLDEAAPIVAETYADQPWRAAWTQNVRGACLAAAGRIAEARPLLAESVRVIAGKWGPATHFGFVARRRAAAIGV